MGLDLVGRHTCSDAEYYSPSLWITPVELTLRRLVGVPLAYFLGVRAQLGTAGFLAAVGVTSFLQACVCGTIISRFQWSEEVARASKMLEQMSATMESSSAEDGAPSEQDDGSSGPLLSSMAMPAPIRQPS
jgi:hypothetical protein